MPNAEDIGQSSGGYRERFCAERVDTLACEESAASLRETNVCGMFVADYTGIRKHFNLGTVRK